MEKQLRRVKKYLSILDEHRYSSEQSIEDITTCPCEYKSSNTPPSLEQFIPYTQGELWGSGADSHAWFHFAVDVPAAMRDKPVQLVVKSDKTGWDADNPQFIAYINGEMRQGMDVNHTFIVLDGSAHADVYVYGYTGPHIKQTRFFASLRNVNEPVEQLYYDIRVPLDMLEYLSPNSQEYIEILCRLDEAVTMLNLYEPGDEAFFASVKAACQYMSAEFYGEFCGNSKNLPTTVGIGHTHIDCAWLWTLKQTREKVQRSFATVLELMKRYPEYQFMSSQALLYKYLKEEAPKLYEEVKRRIAEGRWECEGAMWVEADCNLTSGESLVRQVMYGKRFFIQEFGVDNRILWLPDVFGYSAALPQILRKSGVDWFVTSKISWNDTNMMPVDTFSWIGIDGTPINTYFLTAQDKDRDAPKQYTTYVGNTGAKMVAGTWDRYQQKELNNEALLTFGYGDGGGGPTAEHLEMGRRLAHGIPGAPMFKIDYAGNFLKRLEEKISGNGLLPKWRGELYLEFHRGTYTSIAKNKRNNRKGELLYQNTELLCSIDKALVGTAFPKEELHEGWEMLLTNQFHDIIPGSSIRDVYEQSDIDYAELTQSANKLADAAQNRIAERLNGSGGYVVFNPHSFAGSAVAVVDGVTAIVDNLPSKGYRLTDTFKQSNAVKVEGSHVHTNRFDVAFDDCWQIISIFDKAAGREVLSKGAIANEIRLYADHPDVYDAWEWQEHSLDKYMPWTDVQSVSEVNDGARHGIRITRGYRKSTLTQTIWFWDDLAKIDFDTVVDWHQHNIMVKTAFPVDVNSDKATYEIQFGTIERPTHKNTSWDKAKFETCAQKYADLSDGGYGVSLLNDCKYGYDIHDGVMMLSLFKSATYPNEEADQGEMRFVYSICPHEGRLDESETVKFAYYLNYPAVAVKATGAVSTLPEIFTAATLSRDNVICETVKETEDGDDVVLRLYETKNMKTELTVHTDIPFGKAYLCDLLENEIEELQVKDGAICLSMHGFEIVTIKLKK